MRLVPIGQVVAAHGLRGEVRFRYYNEEAASLRYPSFFADIDGRKTELEPSRIGRRKDQFIIKFMGLDSADEVRLLVGKELLVSEEDLPPLSEGEYYDYQLVGLTAVTEGGRELGTVCAVMHTKANDILVVSGPPEVLVPMTEDHIAAISREEGVVRVKEGGFVE